MSVVTAEATDAILTGDDGPDELAVPARVCGVTAGCRMDDRWPSDPSVEFR
jgi:hypothetical protein